MTRAANWCVVAGAAAVLVALAVWVGPTPVDDAFIGYRYAENLAAGNGLAFNAGAEPSDGYDSLLWTLLCALLDSAGAPLARAAPVASLFFALLSLVLLSRLIRRRAGPTEYLLAPVLIVASAPPLVVAATSGTDAALFSFLLLATFAAMERFADRPSALTGAALAGCMVLVVLCRFEAVLAAGTTAVILLCARDASPRYRRLATGVVAAAAAVTAGYLAWRLLAFGHLVPQALALRVGLNTGLFTHVQPFTIPPFGGFYLIVAIVTALAARLAPSAPGDRFALTATLGLGALYVFVRDPTPALLNHAALLPLAIIPWRHVHRAVVEQSVRPTAPRNRMARLLALAAAVFVGLTFTSGYAETIRTMEESHEETSKALGEWLARWRAEVTLASDRPGAIGYYAGGTVLDLREGSRLGSPEHSRARALAAASPDVVVVGVTGTSNFIIGPSAEPLRPVLAQLYRVLAVLREAWHQDRSILILTRKDIPFPDDELRDEMPDGLYQGYANQ